MDKNELLSKDDCFDLSAILSDLMLIKHDRLSSSPVLKKDIQLEVSEHCGGLSFIEERLK
ncbi:TPA: hypothetical protein MAO59_005220 [Klebsiella pneumoniae]|uniref:hypothetical protein n=1 Tax=Klebsiella quasipneumoniae TaxID=1463165 RepID=UPI0028FA9C36|nr:hypothetical protein [Klebsiella quasipneumoniae]HBR1944566.1 hypothetical protein [Klebsiella pneumoniae]HBT4720168.1 hypothetical protein [Klebsiella quasipneumoniae subsp. similipneumoniae]MDT9740510.1 hypothetical protein [Klebsiella quasipneumoniae]HBR3955268.1 hypothetical protein [Klebsiella pneumoniae]HBS7179596.1 hypothetical protein [Klebsiella pneumoniae]